MASVAALAITFPGGPWVGSEAQNVSADICAARLVSQCCSCLPSTASTHSYRDMGVLCATHTHTHTFLSLSLPLSSLPHFSFCIFTAVYTLHRNTNTQAHTHLYSIHLTAFPLLLLHTLALCLCQFYLSHSVMHMFHCSFLPCSLKTFPNIVYLSWPCLCLFSLFFNLYLTKLLF